MRVAQITIDAHSSEVWSRHPGAAHTVRPEDMPELSDPLSLFPGMSSATSGANAPDTDINTPLPQARPRHVTIADYPEHRPQQRPKTPSLSVMDDTSHGPLPHAGAMTSTENAPRSQNLNVFVPSFIPVEHSSGMATAVSPPSPVEHSSRMPPFMPVEHSSGMPPFTPVEHSSRIPLSPLSIAPGCPRSLLLSTAPVYPRLCLLSTAPG